MGIRVDRGTLRLQKLQNHFSSKLFSSGPLIWVEIEFGMGVTDVRTRSPRELLLIDYNVERVLS